jgi:hypothetical protein
LLVSGSGPTRESTLSADSAATSASSSVKSKTSRFSAMRDGVTDLGITTLPSWRCQRSTTCAGERSYFAATAAMAGSSSRPLPWPSGDHASVTTPCAAWNERSGSWVRRGCSSTWFTAGTTPVASMISVRWFGWKLDTPIERTRPSAASLVNAFQVSVNRPRAGVGQWIRYRSR